MTPIRYYLLINVYTVREADTQEVYFWKDNVSIMTKTLPTGS